MSLISRVSPNIAPIIVALENCVKEQEMPHEMRWGQVHDAIQKAESDLGKSVDTAGALVVGDGADPREQARVFLGRLKVNVTVWSYKKEESRARNLDQVLETIELLWSITYGECPPSEALTEQGRFSTVTRCFDGRGRPYIQKSTERFPDGSKERRLLRNEIGMLSQLRCPHIVNYLGVLSPELLLLESCDESLARLLGRSSLSLDDGLRITEHIARALAYVHEQGIIHRDVKPANVLCSGDVAKLSDFNTACQMTPEQKKQGFGLFTIKGSFAYFPPELPASAPFGSNGVSENPGRVSYAWDMWALGALLYVCVMPQRVIDFFFKALEVVDQRPADRVYSMYKAPRFATVLTELFENTRIYLQEQRAASPDAVDQIVGVLQKTLVINPEQRVSAKELSNIHKKVPSGF